ncbi:DUF3108 domain-containing protein [Ramlibacter tataouinensis]|uniref:DUF3108 domain-containing protein n=1 Tax=Ramlibacter tataouinensis TaxID=94132 RepID=UPI0022F39DC1|nr:DUF3108 domain-containing protein [Ramlibacter tataouinensis]WBY00172.1 DUF3108 domain-containing protein [Ramlibacter tataouinensis]
MNAATGVPPRPLVVLTLGVFALHLLALRLAPGEMRPALHFAALRVRALEMPPARPLATPSPVRAALPPHRSAAATPAAARSPRSVAASQRAADADAPSPSDETATAPPTAAAARASAPALAAPPAPLGARTPAAATPMPIALPAPARWRYAVTARRRGLPVAGGTAELDWRHDGRTYQAVLQVNAPPLPARTQRSDGELGPDGLAPLRFSERLRGEQATHFDRAHQRIVFSSNRPEATWVPGTQDRLSVLLQLAALVAADPARFAPGAVVTLPAATTREAGDWPFRVEGSELLALPAGRITALKLVRAPQHEYDVRLEVWLVPGRDYGPVRLRLTAPNGDWLDLQGSGTDKG